MKSKKASTPAKGNEISSDGTVNAGHLDGNGKMLVFGIASNDRHFYGGSYNQFRGERRSAVFSIAIYKDMLDGEIKRVGFMGTDNGEPLQKELGPEAGNNGIWDIEFALSSSMMGEVTFSHVKGAFFVETVNETYYWLKKADSSDFEFDGDSRLLLKDF